MPRVANLSPPLRTGRWQVRFTPLSAWKLLNMQADSRVNKRGDIAGFYPVMDETGFDDMAAVQSDSLLPVWEVSRS